MHIYVAQHTHPRTIHTAYSELRCELPCPTVRNQNFRAQPQPHVTVTNLVLGSNLLSLVVMTGPLSLSI